MAAPRLRSFFLDQIYVPEGRTLRDQAKVAALASSMKDIGLKTPISVQMRDHVMIDGEDTVGVPVLVAGLTRFRAAESLAWKEIDAFVIEGDETDAELWECDENLARTDLTATEEAEYLARRKAAWTRKQESGANHPTLTGRGNKAFARETAEKTGLDKRNINKAISRAERVAPDVRADIKGTPLDKGVYLDSIKNLPAEEQRARVAHDLASPKKRVIAADPDNDTEVLEKQVAALMAAWNKASRAAREEFLLRIDRPVFDKTKAA